MTSTTIPPEDERPAPCPFCGEDKRLTIEPARQSAVYCGNCGALGPVSWGHDDNVPSAISAWNRRSQPDSDREAIIEECALMADKHACFSDSAWRKTARWIAHEIRSLKHSDTTSNGGKNG